MAGIMPTVSSGLKSRLFEADTLHALSALVPLRCETQAENQYLKVTSKENANNGGNTKKSQIFIVLKKGLGSFCEDVICIFVEIPKNEH